MTPGQREKLRYAAWDYRTNPNPGTAAAFHRACKAEEIESLIAQVEALTVPAKVLPDQCSEAQRNAVYMALHYYMNVQTPDEWKATDEAIAAFLSAAPTIPTIPGTKEGA